jgi:hypothetical protein
MNEMVRLSSALETFIQGSIIGASISGTYLFGFRTMGDRQPEPEPDAVLGTMSGRQRTSTEIH